MIHPVQRKKSTLGGFEVTYIESKEERKRGREEDKES
jgi:hypothetical protein